MNLAWSNDFCGRGNGGKTDDEEVGLVSWMSAWYTFSLFCPALEGASVHSFGFAYFWLAWFQAPSSVLAPSSDARSP